MAATTTQPDRPAQGFLFVLAAAVLGQTLAVSNGHQDALAMKLLSLTLVIAVVAVALPRIKAFERWEEGATLALLGGALAWQFAMLLHNNPGMYLRPQTEWQRLWFVLGITTAAVLAGSGLSQKPLLGRLRMPLLLLVHFMLGCWLIAASPSPIIDVDTIQRASVKALLQLQNPYEITFENIYGSTAYFGTAMADSKRINIGFPYPPLSLLFALPGQALFGDYRYGQLAAMVGAGALMAYARPGRVAPAVATLFLFTPRVFFVLEQGWTDPFLVLLVGGVVFAALRRPRLVPWVFGLLVVVKQYAALVIAFSWLLVRPFTWREFGRNALKSAVAATVVTLPFLLWGPTGFLFSTVTSQGGVPFRPDALSFPAWLGGAHEQRWSALSVGALVAALVIAGWRAPRTPAGFAAALALLYFGFFSFGGHAFCNHYYFILGLLCIAAAAASPRGSVSYPTA